MRNVVYIKIFFLVVALSGVIYVMTHMNSEAVSRALAAFGIQTGSSQTPGLVAAGREATPGEEKLSLCPTRVKSITFINGGSKIEETTDGAHKWVAIDKPGAAPRELAYMEIEKWFSRHCQIATQWVAGGSFEAVNSAEPIEFEYIDGSKRVFVKEPITTRFSEGNHRFQSEDLKDALLELKRVAQIN